MGRIPQIYVMWDTPADEHRPARLSRPLPRRLPEHRSRRIRRQLIRCGQRLLDGILEITQGSLSAGHRLELGPSGDEMLDVHIIELQTPFLARANRFLDAASAVRGERLQAPSLLELAQRRRIYGERAITGGDHCRLGG